MRGIAPGEVETDVYGVLLIANQPVELHKVAFGNSQLSIRAVPQPLRMHNAVAAEVVLFILLDLYQVKKMISDLSQPPTDTTPTADDLEEKE